MSQTKRMDGYVRVSRVGEREGESFISPKVQQEKIQAWAKLHDVTLGQVEKDLDTSGGTAPEERKLEKLIRRCESGASTGIVTWRIDRFSRSAADTLQAVKRLQACGARLVGVDDGVDTDSPGGKLILTVLAGLAEQQLDQASEGWRTARREASKRGVYLTGRPPTGYSRVQIGEKADGSPQYGPLVPDPKVAPVIERAFRLRADGGSFTQVADLLADAKVLPLAGLRKDGVKRTRWSREGARQLLANPLYKGEPRGSNSEAAVERIVSPELWAAANYATRSYPKGNGRTRALLLGLAKCGGCGHALHATGTGPMYSCRGKFASGVCPARAFAQCSRVDDYVLFLLQQPEIQQQLTESAGTSEAQYLATRQAVEAAEAELEAFVLSAAAVERKLFAKGLEVREAALEEARRVFYELDDPGVPEGVNVLTLDDGTALLLEGWDEMGIDRQRRHLRRYVERVVIHRADPARRKHQRIEERVEVVWR
jgi:site-specific DNA recombinase